MVVAAGSTGHHFASCFFAAVLREVLARVLRLVARAVVRLRVVLGLRVVLDLDVLILVVRVVGLAFAFRVALLGVAAVRNTSTAHSPTVGA